VATNPATGLSYVIEPHSGGQATTLRLTGVFWGRLVDIQDAAGTLLFRDFVIGEDIKSDGVDYLLDSNPVTAIETLTILHANGTPEFEAAFRRLESNVTNVIDKSLAANETPPYTMVARNSALVLRFNDLLADGGNPGSAGYPGTVNPNTIQVFVGSPPTVPYELRILPDPNHGDIVDGEYHATRAILDLTVSRFEAQQTGLQVNSLGLPGAVTKSQPNLAIRIPTIPNPAAAQFEVLESLSGTRLAFNGNGSNEPTSPTLDVVRAARSGGTQVGDPNNGFLVDEIAPEILGALPVSINVTASTGPDQYRANLTFGSKQCAVAPRPGDVIQLPNHTLQVEQLGNPPVNGQVNNVALVLLIGDAGTFTPPLVAVGQYRTTWDPAGAALPECFVRFSPGAKTPPNVGVQVQADVVVSFSEPMDPASVQAFQSFELEYGDSPVPGNPLYRRVVGNVLASTDLVDYTLEPSQPLKHHGNPGLAPEQYLVSVKSGALGVTDLAGNQLANALPQVSFTIDPAQPQVDSGGIALDFSSQDEDGNGGPEIRGQFLQDITTGVVNPRAVTHISAGVDPSQTIVGRMIALPTVQLQTPLSNLGSKMHSIWRYFDMGFTLLDDTSHNLDVEGLWWEPFEGQTQLDFFPEFEMRLGHCAFAPDEFVDPGTLLPSFPNSGLANQFDANYGDMSQNPPVIVHPRSAGYQVDPQITVSETSRSISQWPMNVGKAPEDFVYFTWRDTSNLMVGGPGGQGVDPEVLVTNLAGIRELYPANKVPTIGLPLLMEFRTYPDTQSSGQNAFNIAIAINSSARPYFRTFSTGGVLSGQVLPVDPDQESIGQGGIDPILNATTPPQDNVFYYGRADFVVRVNRFHTMWFDSLATGSSFAPAVLEPRADVFPSGTQVVLAFRAAANIVNNNSAVRPWENAAFIDPYGNAFNSTQWGKLVGPGTDNSFAVTEHPVNADESWVSSIALLNGARYVQVRATMISNPISGLTPWVSAVGLSYLR
jgi:hypothetical protein